MIDFETEYVFCKDNRLVLIVECLFAKASTAIAWALEAPPSSPGATAHLHLKQHTQKQHVLTHTLKVAILTSFKILSVGYFELKLHIYALGTSETYFTSCKNGHNRSPLKYMFICYFFSTLFLTHYLRLCKSQFVQSICISVFSTHNSVSFLSEKKSEGSYELQVWSRSHIVMAAQLWQKPAKITYF